MEPNVVELEFSNQEGRSVKLWAVFYGARLASISFAQSPFWQIENVDFPISREWLQ